MKELLLNLEKVFRFLAYIAVVLLVAGFYFIYRDLQSLKKQTPEPQKVVVEQKSSEEDKKTTEISLKDLVADEVSKAVATISGKTETIIKETTTPVVSKTKSTDFITLGATSTSTSTDWETLEGTGVWIDINNDYGPDAYIKWEAALKVAHGNGQAFVRLWDDTHKIAVAGSELSTTNNSDYQTVESGQLALWSGKNLYKVQVKSLNSFEVTYTNGKIKITY